VATFWKHFRILWQLFESILDWSESLVLPNQYCPIVVWKNWGWFLGGFTSWATPISWPSLLWNTIVVHDFTAILVHIHQFVTVSHLQTSKGLQPLLKDYEEVKHSSELLVLQLEKEKNPLLTTLKKLNTSLSDVKVCSILCALTIVYCL